MVNVIYSRFCSFILLALLTSVLLACGGGGGGDKNANPPVTTTPTTSLATASSTPGSGSTPEVPVFETTLSLGAPTSNPIVIPPSPTGVPVKFLAVARGTFYPEQLDMDEIDKSGAVVQANILLLKDDGLDADAFRGDRTYSGQLVLGSVSSVEKIYRVHASHKGADVSSGTGRFWVSGCPSVARPSNPARAVLDSQSGAYVFANEMLVTLTDTVSPDLGEINAIMSDVQGQVVGCIPALRQYLVEITGSTTSNELYSAIGTLKSNAKVADATPNALILNMPENNNVGCDGLTCQWYLERIRAPQAWSLVGGGDEQASVAVIDFGVNCNNPELNCNSGIVSEDTIDHGTGVASLISARKGDGTAMVGVAWNTEIYPFSFIGSGGSQYKMSELITLSMARESIRVINISAATATDPGNQIRNAMCSAIDSGRLIVAAAGNASAAKNCQLTNVYPAFYNSSGQCANGANLAKGLLVVGATDADNNLAQWEDNSLCSNTLYVDIFAPGKDIYAANATSGGYSAKNGTSFAAPLVAGSAAVLWAAQPTLTVAEIHDKLIASAATFSQTATNSRNKTADVRLAGKQLVDLYAAVGGKESQTNPDVIPDVFTIPNKSQVDRNSEVKSAPIIVTGIDATVPIDINGGFYSIDNGPFTNAAGTVSPNQSVVVLLRSADSAFANTEATLTIGTISQTFQVTTVVTASPQPDHFDFVDVTQAQLNSPVTSNILRIAGLAAATPIAIVGGEYALDGGTFTSLNGTVGPNQDIQIRTTAANTPATTVIAVVTIGGVSDSFHVITSPVDTTPEPFTFIGLSNVSPGIQVESNTITLASMNSAALISISGGEYAIDGGNYSATAGTIVAGQTVKVRHKSATTFSSDSYSTLTIGSYSATFHSHTLGNTAPVATNISILDNNGGTAAIGDSLTGTYTYTDADTDPQGATRFRWLRSGIAISGATTVNYTLMVADTGKDIQFEVTPLATAGVLTGVANVSAAITFANSAPKATNILIIDTNGGTLLVGDSLSTSYTYQDADNDLQGISSYRWLRNGVAIAGATAASYQVTSSDSGKSIAVEITPTALTGKFTGVATLSSNVFLGNTAPQATSVVISGANAGKSIVGASLTGAYTFSDVDGDLEGASVYKWLRNGTAINGATTQSYSVTAADSGQVIVFEITPISAGGTTQGAVVRSSNVTINAMPTAQTVVVVDNNGGTLVVGDALTGTYTYADSENDAQGTSKYRWLRNGAAINGATSTAYVLTGTDSGQSISFEVTPQAATGSVSGVAVQSASVGINNSAPIATNVALTDANGGSAANGDLLNGTYTYSDSDGDSQGATTFRWLRNGTVTVSTAQSYSLTAADSGQSIQFFVTPRASSGIVAGTEVASAAFTIPLYIPAAFTFTSVSNAALNTATTSNLITISGINTSVAISITGGQYSLNGGAFTSTAGTATNGQTVSVKVTSSASPSTVNQAVLNIGGVTGSFAVSTGTDTTPDAFSFTAVTGAALSSSVNSGAITVSGINAAAPISITNGQYSIAGGAFTNAAGTVANGQTVTVKVTASATPNTATQAVLTVGGVAGIFSATTVLADTTPDAFTFTAVSGAALSSSVTSVAITVAGINAAAPISITNGQYSIAGGAFTSAAGTVTNGQAVAVKVTASATPNTAAQSVLTVGGVVGTFTATTVLADSTPDAFSFIAVSGAALSSSVTSTAITVLGINSAAPISITNGQYSIDFGLFTSAAGTVTNGQTITVNITASATPNTATQAVLTVGGVAGIFSATTVLADTTPDAFSFTAVTGAALSSSVTSNTVTVSGINAAAPISITNGQYSIAGGAFTSAAGTVTNGQTVTVQVIASATPNTAAQSVLTVGGVAGTFSATTVPADTTPDVFSFVPVINAKANVLITSATITVTGINGPTTITITGGEYAIESGAFTNVNGTVTNAQSVKVRLTSMAGSNTTTLATLTIGGVSTAFSVTTLTDTIAPTAQIIFPAATSITTDLTVLVRGTAADNANNIASVKVNGLLATTGDGFATWQVSVPLVQGANNLAVDVKDAANNTALNAASASITNNFIMRTLASIAIDSLRNRSLVLDNVLKAVIAVDLTSGARTILSNSIMPSSANSFSIPLGIELDATNNRALVVDDGLDAVVAVDLTSGARTILSNASTPSSVNSFSAPVDITLDAAHNRALVVDSGLDALLAVDLTSGARTILSNASIPSSANKFSAPRGVTLDTANNRALVVDYLLDAVLAVDLTSGARTILSNASTPSSANSFIYPVNITLDPARNRALVADYDLKAVVAVDLTSGARTILSNASTPSSANGFSNPGSIKLDVAHNRALVADVNPPSVIAVDLNTGARTILSN